MESDEGTFAPLGLTFTGTNPTAQCIVHETLKLVASLNATQFILSNSAGSDIELFEMKGVPGASLLNENDKYMYFHHSEGDTMTVENSDALDLCTIVWTVTSYIFASLDQMLPR
jgi:carboxypeptidase Q